MLDTFDNDRLDNLQADDISDSLERGSVVFFPESPVPLPSVEDLDFIRQELPELLRLKNISIIPKPAVFRAWAKLMPNWPNG